VPSEPVPVRVVNTHCLADLARHERELLLGKPEHINLDVKQVVVGKFSADAPRDDI
jgi:hypothetical protein